MVAKRPLPQSKLLRHPIRFGYCDANTEDECFLLAYTMNVMGKHATFIGAPLLAINVGGSSLNAVFDNIVDEYFVDVVSGGVYMSACVSHRSTSFNGQGEQYIKVHNTLDTVECFIIHQPNENTCNIINV
eukprot:scaffold2498_cov74-Cyclotella_meneghiniana.AAC.6